MRRADLPQHPLATRFLRMTSAPHAQARLFCFPFAGGSAAAFAGWGEKLKPGIEVWAAQPAGRGLRFSEPPHRSITEMVQDYLAVLRDHLDVPFAFYGHSLGGLIALEITQQLTAEGLALPMHLFIGASAPPVAGLIHPPIAHLSDDGFVTAVQDRYAGIPDVILRDPELMQIFLPALKADYLAYEAFDRTAVTRVSCPVTAFAGQDDVMTTVEIMKDWFQHTEGSFDLRVISGDHFFLSNKNELILSAIKETVLASAYGPGDGMMPVMSAEVRE
jgi:surfactin synthase thioesterase subunit